MRWLLIGLVVWCATASGQVVKCEGVWRNAGDCKHGKVQGEVVRVQPPAVVAPAPVLTPKQAREQRDAAAAQQDAVKWKAMQEQQLKDFQATMDRMPTPKPLKFGPNAPGCGSGPGSPKC